MGKGHGNVINEEDEFKRIVVNFKKHSIGGNGGVYNIMGKPHK
jgi:hypothetical protein